MSTGSEPRRPRFNLLSGPDLSANGMPCVARGKALGISISTSVPDTTGFYESTTNSRALDFILLRSIPILSLSLSLSPCTTLLNDDFKPFRVDLRVFTTQMMKKNLLICTNISRKFLEHFNYFSLRMRYDPDVDSIFKFNLLFKILANFATLLAHSSMVNR